MVLTLMAPLPPTEQQETAQRIARAFRRAIGIESIDLKTAEALMVLDHGQLQRQLNGRERFQLERAAYAAKQEAAFFGRFCACLLDEFGGWSEVLSHGAGRFIGALTASAGQARMARAALPNPRREDAGCGSGSLRVSA